MENLLWVNASFRHSSLIVMLQFIQGRKEMPGGEIAACNKNSHKMTINDERRDDDERSITINAE
jgi:hypothetical protein